MSVHATAGEPPRPWPAGPIVVLLAAVAAALVPLELLAPRFTAHGAPAALAAASLVLAGLLLRHVTGCPPDTAWLWRGFALVAALLAAGQAVHALQGAGVNASVTGPADAFLAATGPATALICVRMVRSTGGRFRARVALDAGVALMALGVALEALLPVTVGSTAPGDLLLTVGYPTVGVVLCAAGLVTLGSVSPPRRPAVGWLLLGFACLAVALVGQARAVATPSPLLDVVMSTGYLGMLAAATRALAADPGPVAVAEDGEEGPAPLAGVVVSYCLAFGVVLLLLGGWVAGRPVVAVEALTAALLLLLTFVRSLVWAADGARLHRQVLRTEAYFRTLVHRAADITLVLDGQGRITWASGAGQGSAAASSWAARDLEGRALLDFVHADDRAELRRALDPAADGGPRPVFRLRTRDGGWRQFETVRTATRTGGSIAQPRGRRVLHLRDVNPERSEELELERLAYTDYLTGLPNRASLMSALESARSRAAAGEPACLLLLDLDGFKPVNDIAGHEVGDQLLVQVAGRLRATVRDRDLVGRLGGDEFAVLVRAGLTEATALAERIVAGLGDLHPTAPAAASSRGSDDAGRAELVFDISGSVGVTELDPADDVATTIRQADLALRAAKAAGKNRVVRHGDAVDSASGRRTRLARDLPAAIEQGQLRVVYQPVIGLEERRVLGVEALVRWDHPVLGAVGPDEFIGLAEDDGLIVPLQREVLRLATADLAGLLAEDRDLVMGVNISVLHLQAGCLAPDVAQALAAAGVAPRRLHLEITESVMIDAEARLESDLSTLREMGCVISLDDFGRGYSSLAYLARLPVDILKMDREFVAGIETDRRGAALVASIVELGRTLGMDVVAEGVETPGQLAALAGMGCRFVQGYLLGRPMPIGELRGALDTFRLDPAASTWAQPWTWESTWWERTVDGPAAQGAE